MQSQTEMCPILGLVGDESALRFERRRVPRYDTSGSAVADFGGGCHEGHVVAGVELVDSSASGIGFVSPTPVMLGKKVRVFIGHSPVPGRSGRVARCIELRGPDGLTTGYRVGLDTGFARAA